MQCKQQWRPKAVWLYAADKVSGDVSNPARVEAAHLLEPAIPRAECFRVWGHYVHEHSGASFPERIKEREKNRNGLRKP